MQLAAIIVSLTLAVVGVALFGRAIAQIYRYVRLGQPVPAGTRTDEPVQRTVTVAKEFLGHTRMNRWGVVGVAHWFVAVGFFALVLTLVHALGQVFQADWQLPIIGGWAPYEIFTELVGLLTFLGIAVLIVIRQLSRADKPGRKSRFAGSNTGQAYFVEAVILIIGVAILVLRGLEGALHHVDHFEWSYLVTYPMVAGFRGLSTETLQNLTYLVATIKIGTSFVWMITVSLKTDMGVAWHRFLAFPNIWFKREADGSVALGELKPMVSGGKEIDFETVFDEEEGAEEAVFGASQVEHFSWKGLLDFSTCTECGRCQSQCPAWNTGKPLSPSSSSCRCATTRTPRPRTCWPAAARRWRARRRPRPSSSRTCRPPLSPRPSAPSSAPPRRTASSTPTCCGPAPPAAPVSSSARWTSSTSTTSSTCAATRS